MTAFNDIILHPLDSIALIWFAFAWISYSIISKSRASSNTKNNLFGLAHSYRNAWMLHMLERENRTVDSTLINTLIRSVAFFTSGTLLVIAGLFTALGSAEAILSITQHIPFASESNLPAIKVKFLLLIALFIYVFFKLAWSLRQYNFAVVMMGAAPNHFEGEDEKFRYANKMGIIVDRGGIHFNEGMRGFEFGLAFLGWFIHPMLFIAATSLVLWVIYRRDYRSNILRAMQEWDQ